MNGIESLVEKHYEELLDEVIELIGDEMHNVRIEVTTYGGKAVEIDWIKRNKRMEVSV